MCGFANAQKLPDKQETSFLAPADIKIDGKTKEWGDQLKAYNTATDIFYTIANDDENLYLVVKAVTQRIIEKMINVGISLTINTGSKSLSVRYPAMALKDGQRIIANVGIKSFDLLPKSQYNFKFDPQHSDSLTASANKLLTTNANQISIQGISGVSDTSISVYNEEKIKVAAEFDSKGSYTYELAIPLKQVGIVKFFRVKYTIKLTSRLQIFKSGVPIVYRYNSAGEYDANQDLDSTTDFSGDYTLVKK